MTESKARDLLRDLAATGALASLPDGLGARELAQAARDQGVAGLLLDAIGREGPAWGAPLIAPLTDRRRADLVRTLGQIGLAARTLALLEARGVRGLPLKGAALAETVYDVESDRPMSDVDVLALERWPEATLALREAGFVEVARGDHAWAFRDPVGAGIVELHRSVVSAPGLFPMDVDGLWARSRRGRGQLRRLPSAEDLLVQLALHAAFQHGLTLSLVQWLDFRRLLEREPIDVSRLREVAAANRAEVPLGAALLAAEAVVRAPVPAPLRPQLPRSLLRWLEPRLAEPLTFVGPSEPPLGRVRWDLLRGRRVELLWRTLVLPETPDGDERLPSRLAFAVGRGLRLARRLPPEPPALNAHDLGEPPASSTGAEVPFGEEVLRECLASFPQVRLTVTGHCMEPALRHGDKVLLVGASRRRARLGDVVLARQREGLRLHRLVWGSPLAWPGSSWRTKADRGLRLDPPLAAADVLASVAGVEGRPKARPRRAARALLSLAGGIAARLRMGAAVRSESLT
jgi:putative nucleotidyltransferase-like protein